MILFWGYKSSRIPTGNLQIPLYRGLQDKGLYPLEFAKECGSSGQSE